MSVEKHLTAGIPGMALQGYPSDSIQSAALADLTVPEVRRLLEIALPLPEPSRRERFAWSLWRRTQCWQAQHSHYRHRSWPVYAGPNPFDTS